MNHAVTHSSRRLVLALAGLLTLAVGHAADPYPQPQAYPQQAYPQSYPDQRFQQPPDAHPMRALFANSLAQVAQTTGNNAVLMLADGLTGSLKNWFDARRQRKQHGANGMAMQTNSVTPSYPNPNYPQPGAYPSNYPAPATDANGYPLPGGTPGGMPNGTPNSGYPAPGATDANGYPVPGGAPV